MRGHDWLALSGAGPVNLTAVRYAGWCGCGAYVAVGDVAGLDRVRQRLLCLDCLLPGRGRDRPSPAEWTGPPPGRPGASA